MLISEIKQSLSSPAFLLDKGQIKDKLETLSRIKLESGCRVLYSIKSLPLTELLSFVKPYVDGFSVSSLYEARLATEILAGQRSLHLTTPGIRPDEICELEAACSHISFNSLTQLQTLAPNLSNRCSKGLRINPELSFTEDQRYDPCRKFSKLGVSLDELAEVQLDDIQGLHFHTVFGNESFESLVQTVELLESTLAAKLKQMHWLNLGGGYVYESAGANTDFVELVKMLRQKYALEVFIEPGNAIVGKAGYLVSTVLDLFARDGKNIAVLDTSINHNPEVFEYQKRPLLVEEELDGRYSAILAGSTCLAGDLFGEYRFDRPLNIGDRVTFKQVGAYSLVKANRFNGYNLPDLYSLDGTSLSQIKSYNYRQYREQWLSD